jgi:hypothetical protein
VQIHGRFENFSDASCLSVADERLLLEIGARAVRTVKP